MRALIKGLINQRRDSKAEKDIHNTMLSNIRNQYGVDTKVTDFERNFYSFVSDSDIKMLRIYLSMYLSELYRTGEKGTGVGRTNKLLSLIGDKSLENLIKDSGFAYSPGEKKIRDVYRINEDTLLEVLIRNIFTHAQSIVSKLTMLLAFVPEGDALAEDLNKKIDELFRKKGFVEEVLGNAKKPTPFSFVEILISSYQKLLKLGIFPEILEEIRIDIETIYLIHFLNKSLYQGNKDKKNEKKEDLLEQTKRVIPLFKKLLERFKGDEIVNISLDHDISKENIDRLFGELENKNITYTQFHQIIRLISGNKYVNTLTNKSFEGILSTIISLLKEGKISESEFEKIETYFEKKKESQQTTTKNHQFDTLILGLGLFDITFLAELRSGEQELFCKRFIGKSETGYVLLYPKEAIERLGKSGIETLVDMDEEILHSVIQVTTDISYIVENGDTIELYYKARELFPCEHSFIAEVQGIYEGKDLDTGERMKRVQKLFEEHKIPLLLYYLEEDNKNGKNFCYHILQKYDEAGKPIGEKLLVFIEKFFLLNEENQKFLLQILSENFEVGIEELCVFSKSRDLELFVIFMRNNFPSDTLSVNTQEYIALFLESRNKEGGSKKGIEEGEQISQQEILENIFGPKFSSEIKNSLSEDLIWKIIEIGNIMPPYLQQVLIHYLIENPDSQSISYLEKIFQLTQILAYIGYYHLRKPKKLFEYCAELDLGLIQEIATYIYNQDYQTLQSDKDTWISRIMKSLKNKNIIDSQDDILNLHKTGSNDLHYFDDKVASINTRDFIRKIKSLGGIQEKRTTGGHKIFTGKHDNRDIFIVLPTGTGDVKYYIILQTIRQLGITTSTWNNL